ncbi:hypothetical protein ACHAWO_012109 [Cyclotella atomus]|uniref:ubiquitinyl hydrolase 1 n=1 Tax=Cyclotella atomus TaxID=382360 RepID=A0ABD3P1B7_9STRA
MRVFLPHAQSNNKLSSSVTNSPREDKRKPEEDEDTTEVAAKKFRVQQQQPEAQLKDPMGGGGKLYPVRKDRELLEVKRGNEDHRNSESTNSSDVVAADNNNEENEGVFDGNAAVMQPSPRDEIGDMAARQNHCNSKLQAVTDRAPANLKSEWEEDPGFEDDNNTISLATWDASSACSSFAASKKSNFESKDRNLHPRTAAAAAAASSLAVKSIEDDYDNDPATISKTDITEDELTQYAQLLRTSHAPSLEITPMAGDGNCLFRAISLQVYGSSDMHSTVRTQCLDFMEVEESHFKDFVAEPYDEYIARKRMDGVHGNHAELQAASELYNRRIEVYVPPKVEPMNIFQQEEAKASSGGGEESTAAVNHPIRLLYMDGNHYDALIDPLVPTAGLGLGLPGLQPGLADRLQLDQAKRESNQIIQSNMERKMQLAIEESKRAQAQKEGEEFERVLRESCVGAVGGRADNEEVEDAFVKKSMYLSELDAADFDLEQAVRFVLM